MAKEGRKEKDRIIKEGFNKDKTNALSKKDLAKAKRQAKTDEKKTKERAKAKAEEKKVKDKEEAEEAEYIRQMAEGDEDAKEIHQMLKDMRWVYKHVSGRKKLRDLVMKDDKQFVILVKELMRLESAILAAKLKKGEEGADGQAVFVILKGLEKPPGMETDLMDIKQLTNVTLPEGGDYEEPS